MPISNISFVETDVETLQATVVARYEQITGRTLYPGNPERLFLNCLVYLLALQRAQIDVAAKRNTLMYADGVYLDLIGEMLGVTRLTATPAQTTLRFNLDTPLTFPVNIPLGTRCTPDGELFFATTELATILVGQTMIEVNAMCTVVGSVGNDWQNGQINQMSDTVSYIEYVENTSVSFGGSDAETDERFQERIRLAPESFSVAGPRDAYQFYALSSNPDVADASVWSPIPGLVRVAVLMQNGRIPTVQELAGVYAVLSADEVRPLTDTVEVISPSEVHYSIAAQYWIRRDYSALAANIQQQVTDAVNKFAAFHSARLGRDVNTSVLYEYIQSVEGVKRVKIFAPEDIVVTEGAVAICSAMSVNYQGLEDL